MCYPKPGPRCAAHTRGAMATSKVALRAAESTLAAFGDPDPSWDGDDLDAFNAATREVTYAKTKYDLALREYETTPQGQAALREAITSMRAEGLHEEANIAATRHQQAKAIRDRQKSDYEESLRYEENLSGVLHSNPAAAEEMRVNTERLATLLKARDEAQQEVRRQQIRERRNVASPEDVERACRGLDIAQAEFYAQGRINAAQRAAYAHGYSGPGLAVDVTKDGALRGNVYANTDGTYNLVRLSRPTAGFPDGRIVPVVGVKEAHLDDGTRVHALRFADGTEDQVRVVHQPNGKVDTYRIPGLRLMPPLPDAEPARAADHWNLAGQKTFRPTANA